MPSSGVRSILAIAVACCAAACAVAAPSAVEVDLSRHFGGVRDGCMVLWDLRRGEMARYRPARCARRFSPCSTFKVPNAMIGLETGVIPDADHVIAWDGVVRDRPETNRDHTLRSAVRESVVWYFQELARRVGQQRMRRWIDTLGYGNRDLSGGLTTFWLQSSLAISADEQVDFLRRLVRGELPFSTRTMEIGRELIALEEQGGRVLRGKTGSGRGAGEAGDLGWFIGSVTGPDVEVVFACNVEGKGAWGPQARRIALAVLAERGIWPAP